MYHYYVQLNSHNTVDHRQQSKKKKTLDVIKHQVIENTQLDLKDVLHYRHWLSGLEVEILAQRKGEKEFPIAGILT